jgi:tRNA U34 5-methylaminomethyl-2-thiouridine-forming methyltransferase MnmC
MLNENRIVQQTADGSHTIFINDANITYHSKYGALQESKHVFINCALKYYLQYFPSEIITVFEMGLGTALNALLTWNEAHASKQKIIYHAVELYPLTEIEIKQLNYDDFLMNDSSSLSVLHRLPWNSLIKLDKYFSFIKQNEDITKLSVAEKFNLIYFDAFDPNIQPELWIETVFRKMYEMLHPGGILVTYCSKGIVRRTMETVGFTIEKLKGPPGKREITRAIKPNPY